MFTDLRSVNDSHHRGLKMKVHHNELYNHVFTDKGQLSLTEKLCLLLPPTLPIQN